MSSGVPERAVNTIMKCIKNHFLLKTIDEPMQLISKMTKVNKLPGDITSYLRERRATTSTCLRRGRLSC